MCAATGSRTRRSPVKRRVTAAERPETALERLLNYTFADPAILSRALVHRSYLNEVKTEAVLSNERLEFLGDAVLGLVIAEELYRRFRDAQEGQLTELRAHIVRWETLGEVAGGMGLGSFLVLGRGEERAGGRARPMILARVYEAIVGALHEDGGIAPARAFILDSLRSVLDSIEADTDVADVKSRLQAKALSGFGGVPAYRTVHVSGPDHERVFRVEVSVAERVLGEGEGRNKRGAERAAAMQALNRLAAEGGSAGAG